MSIERIIVEVDGNHKLAMNILDELMQYKTNPDIVKLQWEVLGVD